MRLPVDFGTPLHEPPRNVHSFANDLVDQLDWAYSLAPEVIGLGHKRAKVRYNERVVQTQFVPGALVLVIRYGKPSDIPSKLAPKYSGLCEVVEVRGAVLTLRELDTQ